MRSFGLFPPASAWRPRYHRLKRRHGIRAVAFTTTVLLVLLCLSSLTLAWRQRADQLILQTPNTTSAFFPVSYDDADNKTLSELCSSFPHDLMQRIQPVLKMGHGESRDSIDAQFQSVSACFSPDELLVFSDLDDVVHGHHAMDILGGLPRAYRYDDQGNAGSDFASYEAMYALHKDGKLTPDNDPARGKAGWRLDKYKFLAGVERAWQTRPGRDFYIFYETDTYISWDNMFRFLSTLDPQAVVYMGSPSPGRRDEKKKTDTWFANGGPGYVLSRGAMEKLLARRSSPSGQFTDPPMSVRWLDLVRGDCCGDSVLGWALWNAGVPLSGFFPLFNPYPVHKLPYTERLWCQPFLTMHKLKPKDMVSLWRWEYARRRLWHPLLYSDLFEFLPLATAGVWKNWDNTNWDRLSPPKDTFVHSLQRCRQACEDSATCHQYFWPGHDTEKCVLNRFINFGEATSSEAGGTGERNQQLGHTENDRLPTSGWIRPRIDQWVQSHQCSEPEWVQPSIERHF